MFDWYDEPTEKELANALHDDQINGNRDAVAALRSFMENEGLSIEFSNGGGVDDESFLDACPLEAFAAVKSDLLSVFILAHQDATDPEFKTVSDINKLGKGKLEEAKANVRKKIKVAYDCRRSPNILLNNTDYDALAATTSAEDITEDVGMNQDTLQSLRDDDANLLHLRLCSGEIAEGYCNEGDYFPGSSEELGWLGHFAKKSTRLQNLILVGSDIFKNCSKYSVDRFFEDLGRCNHIKNMQISTDLEVVAKLGPAMRNNDITDFIAEGSYMGCSEVDSLFKTLGEIQSLEKLIMKGAFGGDGSLGGYIPSLAACTGMRILKLKDMGIRTHSCAALRSILPRMDALLELDLGGNSINDNCVEDLVSGLADVSLLNVSDNQIALARQLPLLKFKELYLPGNKICSGGPQVIAASLANPECRLETLFLYCGNIGDQGVATVAQSLRGNRRLRNMNLTENNITATGWNAFSPVLCDTSSINATHGSNHTLYTLGDFCDNMPRDIESLLRMNYNQDKSLVAAKKILQTHHHLDMKPLLDWGLDLLPRV
ncbi:hypothetical protein THAOC_37097, partial [Thalassiosira oceanica]